MSDDMRCHNIREEIAALAMGGLEAAAAEPLERHMESCADCHSLYEAMRAEEDMIRSTFDVLKQRGRQLEQEMLSRIQHQKLTGGMVRPAWWRSRIALGAALAAAAAVLVIGALVAVEMLTDNQPGVVEQKSIAKDERTPFEQKMPNMPVESDIDRQMRQIEQMFAAGDADGLIEMLKTGQWEAKILAAGYLGRIGDAKAAEALAAYVDRWDGDAEANPFARAIDQIHARLADAQSASPQVEPNEAAVQKDATKQLAVSPAPAEPNYVLCGYVTDALTGDPVTDADVEIYIRRIYSDQTDANGFYHFDEISEDGNYRVKIKSVDYIGLTDYRKQPVVSLRKDAQTVRNFELDRACQIEVTVVDEQGKPIEDAEVRVSSLADEHGREAGYATRRRGTDENGNLLIGGFAPSDDPLLLTVTHTTEGPYVERHGRRYRQKVWDYAAGHMVKTLNDPDVIETAQVVLRKGVEVHGYCEYADGVPAHGLSISAHPSWWHSNYYPPIMEIDPNGLFTLPHVVPGQYSLHIHIPRGNGGGTSFPIAQMRWPTQEELIYARVPRNSPGSLVSISGRIVYVGNKKPSYITIDAYSAAGDNQSASIRNGSDEFEIDSLEPGVYTLHFSGQDIVEKKIENIEAPSSGLEVEIVYNKDAKPVLQGFVVRADTEQPITRFRARVRKLRTLRGGNYVQADRWTQFANEEGAFNIETVGPGVYQVQIAAEGYAWLWSEEMNTDESRPVTVAVTRGGSISGRVINVQGEPVAGATVTALSRASGTMPRTKRVFASSEGSVQTQADGTYLLSNIASGVESIKVTQAGYCFATRGAISVHEGRVTKNVDVVLTKGGSIEGYVFDPQGKAEPTVTLLFQDDSGYGGSGDEEAGRFATAVTDANGFYHVDNLPEQMCYIRRANAYTTLGVAQRTVVPQDGRTLQVDFGGLPFVDGQLVVGGKPLANVRMTLSDPASRHSGLFQCYARTDIQGVFRFAGVPAGTYGIYYELPDERNKWVKAAQIETTGETINLGTIPKEQIRVRIHIQTADPAADFKPASVVLHEGTRYWGSNVGDMERPTEAGGPWIVRNARPGLHTATVVTSEGIRIRKPVVIEDGATQVDVTIEVPSGGSVLTGQFPTDAQQTLILRNADDSINAFIYPGDGSTYVVENLPAGTYSIGSTFTEGSAPLTTFDLADGEVKTLDIDTSQWLNIKLGPLAVQVIGNDGFPLTNSKAWLDNGDERIEPIMSVGNNHSFVGPVGPCTLHVECAGYESAQLYTELRKVDFAKPREADKNAVMVKLRKK